MKHTSEMSDIKNSLRTRPGYLLRRCLQVSSRSFEFACAEAGITERQYDYLFVLGQIDRITQGDLSRVLDIDRSTNALVVGILEKKRLIRRWTDSHDTRKKCISLTKSGLKTLRQTQPLASQSADNILSSLSSVEAANLLVALNKIVDKANNTD